MKAGDRVMPIDDSMANFHFPLGALATVLTMKKDVAWIYPDKWAERVPYEYGHRRYQGLPYLRFLARKLQLKKVCMFKEEVMPIELKERGVI